MYQTSFLSSLPIDPLNEGHMSLTAKSITAKLTDQDILLLKRHVLSQQCMSFLGLLPSGWLHHTIDCLLDRTWVYASNTPGVGLILPGSHLSFKYMNEIKKNSQTFHHLQTSCSLKILLLPFSFRFFFGCPNLKKTVLHHWFLLKFLTDSWIANSTFKITSNKNLGYAVHAGPSDSPSSLRKHLSSSPNQSLSLKTHCFKSVNNLAQYADRTDTW